MARTPVRWLEGMPSGSAEVSHVYRAALHGYAARIPATRLDALRSDPQVAYVSADRAVSIDAQAVPTGINRIDGELARPSRATAAAPSALPQSP